MQVFTNKTKSASLHKEFQSALASSKHLTLATGYIGASLLEDLHKKLFKIAKLGSCKLLVGMVFYEGVTLKQKALLEQLHTQLSSLNNGSGVFISRNEYHGKVYICETKDNEEVVYIGSSNLSEYGFSRRLECNIKVKDSTGISNIKEYINFLFTKENTSPLDKIELKVKRTKGTRTQPSKLLEDYKIDKSEFDSLTAPISQQDIQLRVDQQPNSSLNLYFDKGRVHNGKYTPRPWYEIEITTSSSDRLDTNYPETSSNSQTSNSRHGEFLAYIKEDNNYFRLNMVVHSDGGKNISSSKSSGGRATLGQYIKGKLEEAGVLREGERITSETLASYGKDSLTLKKIEKNIYIMEF